MVAKEDDPFLLGSLVTFRVYVKLRGCKHFRSFLDGGPSSERPALRNKQAQILLVNQWKPASWIIQRGFEGSNSTLAEWYLEDHPMTCKWLITMVIVFVTLRIGLFSSKWPNFMACILMGRRPL